MNSSPPPTSPLDNGEGAAIVMAENIRAAVGRWVDRTRKGGFGIPFVSELLTRITRPGPR